MSTEELIDLVDSVLPPDQANPIVTSLMLDDFAAFIRENEDPHGSACWDL